MVYYKGMRNWSVDTEFLSKFPEKYKVWQLEQLINYGLVGKKINARDLKKYWSKLKLDPKYKKYLSFLLKLD